jgi:hypothetical protein
MKRDPNGPIPGFEEYSGTVGHEKRTHKNMFTVPDKKWKSTGAKTKDWYRVGVGKYRLMTPTEAANAGLGPEVYNGKKKV